MERWQQAGFGLYVHWPFCQSKCPYCDFNSHVASSVDQNAWGDAFELELDRMRRETGPRRLSSIFFGGGTPSLMVPSLVERIISSATGHWSAANDIEITLEANPTSAEIEKFRAFRSAGVNRVSIGVQSLNDADLRQLGRMHDAKEARSAIDMAQTIFDRFSFDLIYARQDQTLAQWEAELNEALKIGSRHLSLYQLTIEPGTVFGARHARGQLRGLPEEDISAEMYELTQQICEAHGLPAYETSNHAAVGEESRHNMIYWRSGDFAAIGPGAHGRLTGPSGVRSAFENERSPAQWMARVMSTGTGECERSSLTQMEAAEEFLVMGLRLRGGLDLSDLQAVSHHRVSQNSISELIEIGMLEQDGSRIAATAAGRILLNSVLAKLELLPSPN
ncbi:radical SAM family heme chaperone HemW [Thioclava sp. FR2]|uniref:radical SAM family heme chaperone HemW n=1 Tax=Thioclava sp. FR2 TaxID=3445780 RepID=UPI003EBADCFA